ncbi:hypothetical protein DFJ73DRAFT_824703, partial [Zopfochytrium polystomum]
LSVAFSDSAALATLGPRKRRRFGGFSGVGGFTVSASAGFSVFCCFSAFGAVFPFWVLAGRVFLAATGIAGEEDAFGGVESPPVEIAAASAVRRLVAYRAFVGGISETSSPNGLSSCKPSRRKRRFRGSFFATTGELASAAAAASSVRAGEWLAGSVGAGVAGGATTGDSDSRLEGTSEILSAAMPLFLGIGVTVVRSASDFL